MRYLLWLLAVSLTLPACAQKQALRKTKTPAKTVVAARPEEPVLVFQRTPCNGRCPTYTATIFADGRVEYDGQRYVSVLGRHTLSLPVATVKEILAKAKAIKFDQLQERYSQHTTDLPATIITVRQPGAAAKAVFAEEGIPSNLQGYIDYLKAKLDPLSGTNPTE